MTPVVAFFNNKGGVGKTTLCYHVAWMLATQGVPTVVLDLDPQANLTASFLDDDRVEDLWRTEARLSVYGSLAPLFEGEGGVGDPHVEEIADSLWLVPGDLYLSGAEQELSFAWVHAMSRDVRAFRVTTSFWEVAQRAAEAVDARLVLVDVGPNLGAINRAAMVASDHVVVPLAPDLYSLQGLKNLGPSLHQWRQDWKDRQNRSPRPDIVLPDGAMSPAGYVVLQHGVRLDRVVGAYDRWLRRVPGEYRRSVLGKPAGADTPAASDDPLCLGLVKHYHSLAPMAQEARKPVFLLRSADGAIGAHQRAVVEAFGHFKELTARLVALVGGREASQES